MTTKEKALKRAEELRLKDGERKEFFVEGWRDGYLEGQLAADEKWREIIHIMSGGKKSSIPDAETR